MSTLEELVDEEKGEMLLDPLHSIFLSAMDWDSNSPRTVLIGLAVEQF
jgi:hypothetical protein